MIFGKPVRITDGVFQFRAIGARVTLLVEDDKALLVDAGLRGSRSAIEGGFRALGLSVDRLTRVVVTHAHPDHSGGLGELVGGRNVSVAAHRLEADIISGDAPLPNPLQNGMLAVMAQPLLSTLNGDRVPVEPLEDGEVVPFRTDVRVVQVPGHTEGSIAIYLPEKGTIIVGDALQYKFARRLSPPAAGVTERPKEAMRSLEKLQELDFSIMCFGHFPPMRDNPRAALRRLIEEHEPGRTPV